MKKVYVIEVNPRASRTVPFLSKVTNIPMAQVATKLILGQNLKNLATKMDFTLKVPAFISRHLSSPLPKLAKVDSLLGPEMKSTGKLWVLIRL